MKELTLRAYKSKEFIKARRLALQYLRTQEQIEIMDPVLNVFFVVESDLSRLDYYLGKAYKKDSENPTRVYKFIYLLLEKGYIAKDIYFAKKWGDIFLREGGESKKYAKGIFIYAGLLYLAEEKKDSRKLLKNIPEGKIKGKTKIQWELLKLASQKKEARIVKQAEKYLKLHSKENYADFVVALIIQSYIQLEDFEKAKEWKARLDRDFPKSRFREEFVGLSNSS